MADRSSDENKGKCNRKLQRSPSDTNSKRRIVATGRDVADLIVGSHRAFDIFKAFCSEWVEHRGKSISLLQQLADVLHKSCKESDKIADVLGELDRFADNVPNPAFSLGTRIATAIGNFFAGLFAKGMSERDVKAKEFEIKQTFQKDIDSTSLVYIHGVQCNSQFEETRKSIETFHQLITQEDDDLEYFIEDGDALEFLNEISFYNPHNVSVFYRRLKICYERLLMHSKSAEGRPLIRVFEEVPEAVQVIPLLAWNFDTDGYDVSVVDNAWKELFALFLNPGGFNVRLFLEKVQNCIFFLKKEHDILQRTMSNLLREMQI